MSFFDFIFQSQLLIFTIPMLFSLVWWLFTLLGLLDIHLFDAHVEGDAHAEMDAQIELEADVADGFDSGDALHALGVGMIPISLLVTILFFSFGWIGISLHGNIAALSNWLAIPLAGLGAIGVGAGLSRLIHPLFRETGKAQSARQLVGKVAVLKSGSLSADFGQATFKGDGEMVDIEVRSDADHAQTNQGVAQYGDRILLTEYDPKHNIYTAIRFDED